MIRIKNLLSFSLGPGLSAVIGFLTIPILTWSFSPDDIARYSLFNVFVNFGILLCSVGLDQAYFREYYDSKYKLSLLIQCLSPSLLLVIILILVSLFIPDKIPNYIFDYNSNVMPYLFSSVLLGILNRYFSLWLRLNSKGYFYSLSIVMQKLIFLFFILICFFNIKESEVDFSYIYNSVFFSYFGFTVVLFYIVFSSNVKNNEIKINLTNIIPMIKYGAPITLGALSFWCLTALDRIFLQHYVSLDELAYYSVALSFSTVVTIFQSIFSTMWSPFVFKNIGIKASAKVEKMLINCRGVSIYVFSTIISLVALFSWLIDFFLPVQYSDVKYLVILSVFTPLFNVISEIFGVGISVSRKTHYLLYLSFIVVVINIALNYYLVPTLGAYGAAVATNLSMLIFTFIKTLFANVVWVKFKFIFSMLTLTAFSLVSCFFVLSVTHIGVLIFYTFWACVLIISILMIVNYKRKWLVI